MLCGLWILDTWKLTPNKFSIIVFLLTFDISPVFLITLLFDRDIACRVQGLSVKGKKHSTPSIYSIWGPFTFEFYTVDTKLKKKKPIRKYVLPICQLFHYLSLFWQVQRKLSKGNVENNSYLLVIQPIVNCNVSFHWLKQDGENGSIIATIQNTKYGSIERSNKADNWKVAQTMIERTIA